MGDHKNGGKRAVNRHQTQSKASAASQERAIERTERQAGQKAAEQWLLEEAEALDRQYAEAAAFDAANTPVGPPEEEEYDEYEELHSAGLSMGQP